MESRLSELLSPTHIRLAHRLGRQPTEGEVAQERARLAAALERHWANQGLVCTDSGALAIGLPKAERVAAAGVPRSQAAWTLDSWVAVARSCNHHAVQVVRAFVERCLWDSRETLWVWASPECPGVGRTGLAVGAIRHALDNGLRVAWGGLPRPNIELLVLDDVDSVHTDWWRIAETVEVYGTALLCTARQPWQALADGLDARGATIIDRLQPVTELQLAGSSIRATKKKPGRHTVGGGKQ